MKFKFKCLSSFYSQEMQSQYVAGMVYTCHNTKLAGMVERWLKAKRFKMLQNALVMGAAFNTGNESYALDTAMESMVGLWVTDKVAEWIGGALITLDFDESSGPMQGGASAQKTLKQGS